MSQPQDSHLAYPVLRDRLAKVLDDTAQVDVVLRIFRYALEMEALTRLRNRHDELPREILHLADALAEPGSPRLAAAYDALAGEQS